MKYIHRNLEKQMVQAARHFPALVLTGPRRAGKTMLLRRLFPRRAASCSKTPRAGRAIGLARDFTSNTKIQNIMKTTLASFKFITAVVLLVLAAGCASTKHTEQTEQMLSEAGFKQVVANSEKQVKHLQTLPVDRLTVVKLKGKTLYVFPDPAHNLIYVGNLEEYQTYQQILSYNKIEAQNRVMADLGEDTGDDELKWADWSSNSGWTYGSY
jgi:hypothetical protein